MQFSLTWLVVIFQSTVVYRSAGRPFILSTTTT